MEMPETSVSITESTTYDEERDKEYHRKQYRTTIPKDIAEFFEMDEDTTLEWKTGSARNKLEVVVHDE